MKQLKKRRGGRARGTRAGREIIEALTELVQAVESGEPLERQLTVRTVELPGEPEPYAKRIRARNP